LVEIAYYRDGMNLNRNTLTTVAEIVGGLMIVSGVAFVWLPLALMVGGVLLIVAASLSA